jgi:hypothetical protein
LLAFGYFLHWQAPPQQSVSFFGQWLSDFKFRLRLLIDLSRQFNSLSETSQKATNVDFSNINWLAVFVASISSFIIGAVWFGPKTFYPIWVKAQGREMPVQDGKSSGAEMALMFGGTYVGALVQVATLAVLLELARLANPTLGAGEGAFLGLVFGIGLGAFASLSHRFFGQANGNPYSALKVWLIEVGQDVLCLTIAGAIIGAWV